MEVALQRRVFLVGPNASGKSNILDALRFLHDIVAIGGGFQAAVRGRNGVSAIRSLAARRYPDVALIIQLGDEENPARWEYELKFTQDNQRRPIIKSEHVRRDGKTILTRPLPEDVADPERLTQTYLEQVQVNQEFREISDFLTSMKYLHIVPQLVREPDRSVGRENDPFGGDFLERIARTPRRTQEARLRRIREALRVAVPQLEELELWRDARGTPHLRGKYQHWRPQGAWQTEEQFSDGTLRLIGLLWAVLDGTGPLLLEEPELSLHLDVVRVLPLILAVTQRRSGRQIIMSTHSADLLRDEGIGLDEVLLLLPAGEGTEVRPAAEFEEISALVDGGVSLADAVVPKTRPKNVEQLAFFDG
jgi:predicted ATPase